MMIKFKVEGRGLDRGWVSGLESWSDFKTGARFMFGTLVRVMFQNWGRDQGRVSRQGHVVF